MDRAVVCGRSVKSTFRKKSSRQFTRGEDLFRLMATWEMDFIWYEGEGSVEATRSPLPVSLQPPIC